MPQQGKISAEILGVRVKVYVMPVIGNGIAIGTLNMGLPMIHPV